MSIKKRTPESALQLLIYTYVKNYITSMASP